ncbi:hypothetical protein FVE85_7254 [Porphyridium purpureum]|uniref:Uncharacterized protein n=1 Tax=Porphyridium purpureum TaxID=35688 RepID=A0A5J4Z6I1_PORPP|nr:hypothetical protein FVE85_7254 [Porphyridium purpureum]|eukprot:POR9897..scf295_1
MALVEGDLDPLLHEDWEPYWKFVEEYFRPIRVGDLELLGNLELKPQSGGAWRDPALLVPPLAQAIPREDATPDAKRNGVAGGGSGALGGSDVGDAEDSDDADERVVVTKKRPRKLLGRPGGDDTGDPCGSPSNETVFRMEESLRLPSYPLTQRLIAALVDEGDGEKVPLPGPKSKANFHEEMPWFGPADEDTLQAYKRGMEERIASELKDLGLFDKDADDEVQFELRLQQWKLRDTMIKNRVLRNELFHKTINHGLKVQAKARELKKSNDDLDILYLERMIRKSKKNKRVKSKYQRILSQLYPNYKQKKDGEAHGVPKPSVEASGSKPATGQKSAAFKNVKKGKLNR